MLLSEYSFCVLTGLALSKVNGFLGLFWENTNHVINYLSDSVFQWLFNLLSYCLLGDMFTWLENRVRICEALLLGSVFLLVGIAIRSLDKGKDNLVCIYLYRGDYVNGEIDLSWNPHVVFYSYVKGLLLSVAHFGLGKRNPVVFVDDYFGMTTALNICSPNVGYQFGYRKRNGPATWKEHYENALGEMQSPINIVTCDAVMVRTSPLMWSNHESIPEIMIMHNDGYSVTIQGVWKCEKPQITGMAIDCVNYVFNRLYFHWGPTDTEGSEHTINYERYPLEVHAMYLKEGYSKPMDAHYDKCPNGILIIAFLFEIAPVDNPSFLHTVTENLFKIRNPKSHCYIEPFPLSDIFPEFGSSYFKYDGSITQPPCSEIVRYIIQTETIAVSRRQMAMFRKLIAFDGKPMVNNSRPVQKLNSRAVYYCC